MKRIEAIVNPFKLGDVSGVDLDEASAAWAPFVDVERTIRALSLTR